MKLRANKPLAATLFFFLAIALPLCAQTNQPLSPSNMVAGANSSVADTNPLPTNQAVRVDNSGIQAGGANPGYVEIAGYPHERLTPSLGLGTTVVSVMPFLFPVAIIAVVFYFNHRRTKLAHETLRLMIEKGTPITPEIIANLNIREKKDGNPQIRYLLPGLILVGVGIGVLAVAGKPGWILLLIGVAFLIVWLVERKNKTNAPPPET